MNDGTKPCDNPQPFEHDLPNYCKNCKWKLSSHVSPSNENEALACGHIAPDWDGNGNCITCTRNTVLGENEDIDSILRDFADGIAAEEAWVDAKASLESLMKLRVIEAEKRGAAFAAGVIGGYGIMGNRKTVDVDWLMSPKAEQLVIDFVEMNHQHGQEVVGMNQALDHLATLKSELQEIT